MGIFWKLRILPTEEIHATQPAGAVIYSSKQDIFSNFCENKRLLRL